MPYRSIPYQHIVVLTGAGISAESGIKTFRGQGGLWEGHKLEDVCTPEAFKKNPNVVQQFYNARRSQLVNEAQPNAAHKALVSFSQQSGSKLTLITQNVDDLHERSGSDEVLHMHGELLKVRCVRTLNIFDWTSDVSPDTPCSCCQRAGTLRPHIVWFNEIPFYMGQIEEALNECDLFIAIGTSGSVYPAAGFVQTANSNGARTIEMNLEPTSGHFQEAILGLASQTVPIFFAKLLQRAA